MTLEDCVNSRIQYLEALPTTARNVWIAASYEVWAKVAFRDDALDLREDGDPERGRGTRRFISPNDQKEQTGR